MLRRTLLFQSPAHLFVRNKQLVVNNKETEKQKTVPIEDVGWVIIDNNYITLSISVLYQFAKWNIALITCNEKHHPVSLMLNLDSNNLQGEMFEFQINATDNLKKNLWKQTIKAKIINQALLLKKLNKNYKALINMSKEVKTGDITYQESRAARFYWKELFSSIEFKRERFGGQPNSMLNYSYAVLRAATAKALMGSGLLPTFGIFHRNRYNAYRLADDIMEPYRPIIDENVIKTFAKFPDYEELTTEIKAELLQLLTLDVKFNKLMRPLAVALSYTTASLAKCFAGERRKIVYPKLI